MKDLKTALITGVSGGIGKAIAKEFIDKGYFVIGQYNSNQTAIDKFSAELKSQDKADNFLRLNATCLIVVR